MTTKTAPKIALTLALMVMAQSLFGASDVTVRTGPNKGGKFAGANPKTFTPSKPTTFVGKGPIKALLNKSRSVVIKTASSSTGNGDLNVEAPIDKTKGKPAKVTLDAVRDLAVKSPITSTKNTLAVDLKAGRAISSTAEIKSNGGDVTINTVEPFEVGAGINAGVGKIVVASGSVGSKTAQTLTAATVEVAGGAVLSLAGKVAGNLSVAGTVAPGADRDGALQVDGLLTLLPTATTAVNLGGTAAANYGKISVTGAVALAGSLAIDFTKGFEDLIIGGQTFTIFTAASVTGIFVGLENESRFLLPDDLGSLKITYTPTSVVLSDWQPIIVDLLWDPGTLDDGTHIFTNTRLRGRRHYFKVQAENTDIGAWRTRVTTTEGEADVYMSRGVLPTTTFNEFRSKRVGDDGFVLNSTQFAAAQDWYILTYADPGAPWSIFSGRAFVHDMGTLPWTDANGSTTYDIGEPVIPALSGPLPIKGEGMLFYKATVPTGTPAWSLWLDGSNKAIAIRKAQVPFHESATLYVRKQTGQMLVVPPVLGSGTETFFMSVVGAPGDIMSLDSRIQEVTDIPFDSVVDDVEVPAAPYRVYRVQVPLDQIAWDVRTVALNGNPNVAVRRDTVPAEFDNDAFSEVAGSSQDSITLVPSFLTDGSWYITVYGENAYRFNLRNGPPTISPINYTDSKLNNEVTRAGWRYYALTNVPSQLGTVGWELQLANQVPGSEIAIRRNAVPSRWRSRINGVPAIIKGVAVDVSNDRGYLQNPGHQADIWYVGVYMPDQALGPFILNCYPILPPEIAYDGGVREIPSLESGRWGYVRIDIPEGTAGWDVRVRDVDNKSFAPPLVVRRDQLPGRVETSGFLSGLPNWPSGFSWAGGVDWTGFTLDGTGVFAPYRLVAGTGRPLDAGTYYVGVLNTSTATIHLTIDSRGVGAGRTYPVTSLDFDGGTAPIDQLAPREAVYFKVTVPANTPSWEVTLGTTTGELGLYVRRGAVSDFNASPGGSVYLPSTDLQSEMRKLGPERYVMLPDGAQEFLIPGDYYVSVVGEGTGISGQIIGTGGSSGLLTSLGPLAVAQIGPATPSGVTTPVSLVAGQIKLYQFEVPQETQALEMRLNMTNGSGVSFMSTIYGPLSPVPYTTYGADGGIPFAPRVTNSDILTISNPPSGVWTVEVNAGTIDAATADLIIVAVGPRPLDFDGGVAVETNHPPATWRYFTVDVPPGVVGWDVRVRNVTGPIPQMVVKRDILPATLPNGWSPWTQTAWPSGFQWQGTVDWTNFTSNADGSPVPPRQVMGMGRPLEPGRYYVGILSSNGTLNTSYTVDSRGIGAGQTYPVVSLPFADGSAVISDLAPREAKYFKVTIPPNTPAWEPTLLTTTGEMELLVRRDTVPDFASSQIGSVYNQGSYGCEVEVRKAASERYVLLPNTGQDFLSPGDYYLAVVGEGVDPTATAPGISPSSGVLSSGPLLVKDLGTASPAGTVEPVNLVSGQIRAYEFTVPAGTESLEVRLDDPDDIQTKGFPAISLIKGRFPIPPVFGSSPHAQYGFNGGENGTASNTDILTVANPGEGIWRVLVRARHNDTTKLFPPAAAKLIVTALTTVPLAFDGGTYSISSQPPSTWRYFSVEVPVGAVGWDIRLRDVTGKMPALMVRRDVLPEVPLNLVPGMIPAGWAAPSATSWPTGNQWLGRIDWTEYAFNPIDVPIPPRLVAGMGRPLEPGTYFVGVYNNTTGATNYTVDSRGIGNGYIYGVPDLAYTGGVANISELAPREAKYFRVAIPPNTPSWEVTLQPTSGELALFVRDDTIPDFSATQGGNVYTVPSEVAMKKAGPERYVLLPSTNQQFLPTGDYFIAVVSQGINPAATVAGSGTASGVLTSTGALPVTQFGAATVVGVSEAVNLAGGQIKAYQFTVPAGSDSLEIRLDNAVGHPALSVLPGALFAVPPGASPLGSFPFSDYGFDGGTTGTATQAATIHTTPNPAPGVWSLLVRARHDAQFAFPDASANLVVKVKDNIPLNFAQSLNAGGGTHTDQRQAIDGEFNIYEVNVPATLEGQSILGWIIETEVLQGAVSLAVYKDFTKPLGGANVPVGFAVVVPPFLTTDTVWYVRVKATGLTEYRISSRPITLERPVWQMPTTYNAIFGDSGIDSNGVPVPGDRGVDLQQGAWHFYAIDVPEGNLGLLKTELQAISGNSDLYIREDGVPTTHHFANGASGASLVNRQLTGATTSYGNWVPLTGRTQSTLRPGRWYLGVRAGGDSNVRYRLLASTGIVKDLALDPSSSTPQIPNSISEHSLADNDWRYYRFTVPADAPKNWALTFSQQVGDVVMYLRDSLPPGQTAQNGTFYIVDWSDDLKNQGPYASDLDTADSYTFTTPPLRPGHTYFAGFRSKNSATFSVSSDTSGGVIGTSPSLDFYTGSVTTNIPANGSVFYQIPAPADATRMKYTSTHVSGVVIRMEQGTHTSPTGGQHLVSTGANSALNQKLLTTLWPWQPNQTYYVRFANTTAAEQSITFTLNGKNAATEDEDTDGLPDAWEVQFFGNLNQTGIVDTDKDGVDNATELADGTQPNNADSAKYTLSVSARNGVAVADPIQTKYDKGTVVNVSNTAAEGYGFTAWSGGPFKSDDFAIKATATITIPVAGTWTFGVNASDGARLKVNGTNVFNDDTQHEAKDTFGQVALAAGTHTIDLVAFERLGGEGLELFAAQGGFTSFNENFELVGDTASGGLAVETLEGGLPVPGFTVRQVESFSTATNLLSVADNLLSGSTAARREITGIIDTVNFANYDLSEGHFINDAHFPLCEAIRDNPLALTMYANTSLIALNSIPLAAATDAPGLVWKSGGNSPWQGENSATAFDTVDAAGTGPVSHSESSFLQTVVTGPGTLTFRWKVSSQSGDALSFTLDTTQVTAIAGEVGWTLRTQNITAGTHTLTWLYRKDASGSAGSDRGSLDQVTFTPQ